MASTELELWHFWPDCFDYPCYECLWWDITYWIESRFAPNYRLEIMK